MTEMYSAADVKVIVLWVVALALCAIGLGLFIGWILP